MRTALRLSQQTNCIGPVQKLPMIDVFKGLGDIRLQGEDNLPAVPGRLGPHSKDLCRQLAALSCCASVLRKLP
eukprot:6491121-Amphidinium_carterae.3